MPPTHAIALGGLLFLLAGGVQLLYSIQRGRRLCKRFAQRHPQEYAAHNSPWPGLFNSPRRIAYYEFVLQKKFEQLTDRQLTRDFEDMRKREVRELVFILSGFGALGIAYVWIEWLGGG